MVYFTQRLATNTENRILDFEHVWSYQIPGLVRVPFFDACEPNMGYVVYYSEKLRIYGVLKFTINPFRVIWENRDITNGGYGTPTLFDDLVVLLSHHCSISALDKESGKTIWTVSGPGRTRCSPIVYKNLVYFSSGNTILGVSNTGTVIHEIKVGDRFLFGTLVIRDDTIFSCFTKHDPIANKSIIGVICTDFNSNILYETVLSHGGIISSDCSGLYLMNDYLFVNAQDVCYKLALFSGELLWRCSLGGFGGRHFPVVSGDEVYVTTLSGLLLEIDNRTGSINKRMKFNDDYIVSPPSVVGNLVTCISGGYLNVLDRENFGVITRIPTGHSPYSAVARQEDYILFGGGEPPMHGMLHCLKLSTQKSSDRMFVEELSNNLEDGEYTALISNENDFDNLQIDVSVLGEQKVVCNKVAIGRFFIKIGLSDYLLPSSYTLPIEYYRNGKRRQGAITINLRRRSKLPRRVILRQFHKKINQETPFSSGAAIVQMVRSYYGNPITQSEFRKIIDHVKLKSEYEDADFQTWRLILRRALVSPASTLDVFKELEGD